MGVVKGRLGWKIIIKKLALYDRHNQTWRDWLQSLKSVWCISEPYVCRTEYDTVTEQKCETKYEVEYSTIYEPKCETKYDTKCEVTQQS